MHLPRTTTCHQNRGLWPFGQIRAGQNLAAAGLSKPGPFSLARSGREDLALLRFRLSVFTQGALSQWSPCSNVEEEYQKTHCE